MGKRTSYVPGTFCWVDLATTDPAAAKTFYTGLFNWTADDRPVGGMTYTMLKLGDDEVAGLYELDAQMRDQGIPPNWFNLVSVEDAAASAEKARELGGTVLTDAFDVMDFGRLAVIQDPVGAAFGVWQPGTNIGASRVNDPGSLTWNELNTRDYATAIPFYTGLFGWSAEPMEDDGKVTYVTLKNGDRLNGGIMVHGPEVGEMPSFWMPYFTVESTDDAVAKVNELGGVTLNGPMDLPNGRIAVVRDPQGAAFAVFQGEVDD